MRLYLSCKMSLFWVISRPLRDISPMTAVEFKALKMKKKKRNIAEEVEKRSKLILIITSN